ncbi:hypothetical protein [Arthrobacter sp. MA-N2]|uniref:hypothetical protein n=1 Tax=Arthrobacter sp. MA-N2 TaxID=1101188 RepID=UPI0004890B6D|nr:hypothetical protein [Arthrobacter sp. MA-N2]
MNARDELAEIIQDCGEYIPGSHADDYVSPDKAADAILAAGYRKPRTIENDKLVIDDGILLLEVGSCTCTPHGSSHEAFCGYEYLEDLTGPLERAGYRKTRTVTTVEELDALPEGAVVHWRGMTAVRAHEAEPAGLNWIAVGSAMGYSAGEFNLSATVLFEGEA